MPYQVTVPGLAHAVKNAEQAKQWSVKEKAAADARRVAYEESVYQHHKAALNGDIVPATQPDRMSGGEILRGIVASVLVSVLTTLLVEKLLHRRAQRGRR